MGTEKKAREIRREEIAQAALQLISSHGMKGLNMVRVARRVGLVPSAIYRHFKNKEDVFDAVFDLIELKMHANTQDVMGATPHALERLHALLRLNVRMIIEFQAIPKIAFSEGVFGLHPDRRARTYKLIQGYIARIEEIVRDGQAAGEIRSDMLPSVIATGFWGMIPPAAMLWSASEGRYDITGLTEKQWMLFSEMVSLRDAT